MREIKTLCPYCGVGCGMLATTDGSQITRLRGDPAHPANFGKLCAKGGTIAQTIDAPTRLRHAMMRATRDEPFEAVSRESACNYVAERLAAIRAQHGPGSIAFYLSGQMTTEAQYAFSKFGKGILGTNHVDANSRLCMASAASGMMLSLGSDGPPVCYEDIELADTFLFIGSNAADCHPITFGRVKARIDRGRAKCVVVDPRRTATAEAAHIHLATRPGTDLALLNGILHLLHAWGKLDRTLIDAHTEGWADVEAMLADYPPAQVAHTCRIPEQQLIDTARLIANAKRLITFWTMGVNQSIQGTFTSNAIINLHLATGQIGKPGCGPFSLTGQANAMGGRDVGYMSHVLSGQRQIANPEHRRAMERFWGIPAGSISPEPGYDTVRMFEAMETGEIRAIWIICTNPAASLPNLSRVRRALERAELVIVQDAYSPTETTEFADVLLPAAVNLEQAGTFCNSERRVSLMEQVVPPPGDAMPDWWWACTVAQAMGYTKGMNFQSAEQIFDEFSRSTAGRPNDQSALTYALLRARGPQCWPYPALGKSAVRRYTDLSFPTPSGKARFHARRHLDEHERPTREFPLTLTTGRVANQWHTRTKTGLVGALNKLDPSPFVQMHPQDAAELLLQDGQRVRIRSPRGHAHSILRVTSSTPPGVVFMPIHWNALWERLAGCNEATTDARDAISRQPALKICAVRVEPCSLAVLSGDGVRLRSEQPFDDDDEQPRAEQIQRQGQHRDHQRRTAEPV